MILDNVKNYYLSRSQTYLCSLYTAILVTGYYGLLRVGELTTGDHPILAENICVARNKNKIQIVLRSSKTHTKACHPQIFKIVSANHDEIFQKAGKHCPHAILRQYVDERENLHNADLIDEGPFFVFSDRSMVKPRHLRLVLRKAINPYLRRDGF